ncbi:MAG: PKD domain-containing protein [Armatimonadota bacterium]|jgi:hypothetical protein
MRCLHLRLILLTLAVCLIASVAAYAQAARDVFIFKGEDPSENGMVLGGWGSGAADKTKEMIFDGGWSIKITTQGLYSGGRIEFGQPVTLFSDGIDKTRYIQFVLFFNESQVVNPAPGYEYAMSDVEPYRKPKASKVRFVFVSDTGQAVEAVERTVALDADDNWMRVAVPLAKFSSIPGIKEFRMKQLMIFTDTPGTVFLGSMKLVTDTTPIKVDPLDARTTSIMYTEYFVANAEGGVSNLNYAWDFDSRDGIMADSTGRIAKYTYKAGGEYTVTLTVSDANGLKDPVTVSTVITVTD